MTTHNEEWADFGSSAGNTSVDASWADFDSFGSSVSVETPSANPMEASSLVDGTIDGQTASNTVSESSEPPIASPTKNSEPPHADEEWNKTGFSHENGVSGSEDLFSESTSSDNGASGEGTFVGGYTSETTMSSETSGATLNSKPSTAKVPLIVTKEPTFDDDDEYEESYEDDDDEFFKLKPLDVPIPTGDVQVDMSYHNDSDDSAQQNSSSDVEDANGLRDSSDEHKTSLQSNDDKPASRATPADFSPSTPLQDSHSFGTSGSSYDSTAADSTTSTASEEVIAVASGDSHSTSHTSEETIDDGAAILASETAPTGDRDSIESQEEWSGPGSSGHNSTDHFADFPDTNTTQDAQFEEAGAIDTTDFAKFSEPTLSHPNSQTATPIPAQARLDLANSDEKGNHDEAAASNDDSREQSEQQDEATTSNIEPPVEVSTSQDQVQASEIEVAEEPSAQEEPSTEPQETNPPEPLDEVPSTSDPVNNETDQGTVAEIENPDEMPAETEEDETKQIPDVEPTSATDETVLPTQPAKEEASGDLNTSTSVEPSEDVANTDSENPSSSALTDAAVPETSEFGNFANSANSGEDADEFAQFGETSGSADFGEFPTTSEQKSESFDENVITSPNADEFAQFGETSNSEDFAEFDGFPSTSDQKGVNQDDGATIATTNDTTNAENFASFGAAPDSADFAGFEGSSPSNAPQNSNDDDFGEMKSSTEKERGQNDDDGFGDWTAGTNDQDDDFADFGNFGTTSTNDDFGEFPDEVPNATPAVASSAPTSVSHISPPVGAASLFSGSTSEVRKTVQHTLGYLNKLQFDLSSAGDSLSSMPSLEDLAGELMHAKWEAKDPKRVPKPQFTGTYFETQFLSAIGKQPLPTVSPGLSAYVKRTPSRKPLDGGFLQPSQYSAQDSASISAALGLTPTVLQPSSTSQTLSLQPSTVPMTTGSLITSSPTSPSVATPVTVVGPVDIPLAPMDFSMFGSAPSQVTTSAPAKPVEEDWMKAFMGPSVPKEQPATKEPLTVVTPQGKDANEATGSHFGLNLNSGLGSLTMTPISSSESSSNASKMSGLERKLFESSPKGDMRGSLGDVMQGVATPTSSANSSPMSTIVHSNPPSASIFSPPSISELMNRSGTSSPLHRSSLSEGQSGACTPVEFEEGDEIGPAVYELLRMMPNLSFMNSTSERV